MTYWQRSFCFFFFCLTTYTTQAESPAESWQTLHTPHFRFHYIAPFKDWTERTAAQAESVFAELATISRNPIAQPLDVLVIDPENAANGAAFPIAGRATIVLFTTPPAADSIIGNFNHWPELLIKHELVHVFHLARPNRDQWKALLSNINLLFGLSDIPSMPVWATEGYATYMEGKLTGSGRPYSDLATSMIRELATQGQLPAYDTIGDNPWLGRTLNYLVGAAYYEWLSQRSGGDAFTAVWQRMMAIDNRDFDQAFEGVFGEPPSLLYQRFVAETTHAALQIEKSFADAEYQGQLWQRFNGRTGEPSISPDGKKIAVLVREPKKTGVLKIFAIDNNEEAFSKWQKKRDELAQRDPQDVPAQKPKSLPRKALSSFANHNGSDALYPRWIDNEELLFTLMTKDAHNDRHGDLFRWNTRTDELQRITHAANITRAAPSPDGQTAVAVRSRFGLSQLVRVDLKTGDISELTPASLDIVYDQPRFHPDGRQLVYLRHNGEGWALMLRDLQTASETSLYAPADGRFLSFPVFAHKGSQLLFSAGDKGFVHVYAMDLATRQLQRLTQSSALLFAAEPVGDSNTFMYLRFTSRGVDLYEAQQQTLPALTISRSTQPGAVQTPAAATKHNTTTSIAEFSASEPYGIGPQHYSAFFGINRDAGDTAYQLGLRGGDPVGRLDWLAAVSQSDHGSREGALLSAIWRGWPLTLSGNLFYHDIEASQQRLPLDTNNDTTQIFSGASLQSEWLRQFDQLQLSGQAGILWRQSEDDKADDQTWLNAGLAAQLNRRHGDWSWRYRAAANWAHESDADRARYQFDFAFDYDGQGLGFDWQKWQATDAALLSLGGGSDTVFSNALDPLWISDAMLPWQQSQGQHFTRQKMTVDISRNTPTLFYQRQRFDDRGDSWQSAYGVEIVVNGSQQFPLAELRGLGARLGIARVEENEERDTRWWLAIDYRW